MFTRGLSKQAQKNLETLSAVDFVSRYYLAGGTALSLHFGHRISNDLDFFSKEPVKSVIIASTLKNYGELEIFQSDEGTLNGVFNNVKLSFFLYPYRMLEDCKQFSGVKIAAIDDIACMKIEAIASRGMKRDFIDLYTIINKHKPLVELLSLFHLKYQGVKYNKLHIIKSLVYFTDADEDEMPQMIHKVDWEEVKRFFEREAGELL